MGRRHRQRRTSKYFFYRRRTESKSEGTVQVKTISSPGTTICTITPGDGGNSSSSLISMSTFPSSDSTEYPSTPTSIKHVVEETITLPRTSAHEKCEDDIMLPRNSGEFLISEDKTEQAEEVERKSKETLRPETVSVPHTLKISPEDGRNSSSSWISMSSLPSSDSTEYYFTPIGITVPEHVVEETIALPRTSADEKCEDDIMLPRNSAEGLISEDKTEQAEETECESKETLQPETVSVPHTLTISPEDGRNSSSSWISMSSLPNFDSMEYPLTPTSITPEQSEELPIFLPRISAEKSTSDAESDEGIILPSNYPENITSEDKTQQTETSEADKPACKRDFMTFFNIIEKMARMLKSGTGERLTSIFEKSIFLIEDKDAKETDAVYEIMDTFLENLENYSPDYLLYLKAHLNEATLPKELRTLYVDKNKIIEHYFNVGTGGFGEVRRGQLKKPGAPFVTVAIKQAHQESYNRMFLEEASVMAKLNHEIILKLLAVTHDRGKVELVLEYMENGDLVDAIIMERLHLSPSDILTVIHDVVSGMQYLAEKQYVHRDLKCANVFINLKKECKIGDFGLCKYVGNTGGVYVDKKMRLDGPHVAPETKNENRYSTKSDVWAMGLLIWELYSIRKTYSSTQNVLKSLYTVEQMWKMFLLCGHLLQVQGCPTEIHNYLVKDILNKYPANRPSFGTIKKKIIDIIKKNHNYVTFPN